jgi:hypothetical protein
MDDGNPDVSTAPPPHGTFFIVTVYDPDNIALARRLGLHILSLLTSGRFAKALSGRTPQVESTGALEVRRDSLRSDVVIVTIDEFCDPAERLREVRSAFSHETAIIAHLTLECPLPETGLVELGFKGTFRNHALNVLESLVDAIINGDPHPEAAASRPTLPPKP